ncbi:hypothetical protein GQ54DRAFT_153831 [Martensiomyces pterosporus]|nr:hypothetical protein GQ54DRAFT_153831 [Martensiomyces pterosporus]
MSAPERIALLRMESTPSSLSRFDAATLADGQLDRAHEDESQEPLYEDNYIKVTHQGLTIYKYWFPLMNSMFIKWEDIEYVRTAKEANVKWYEVKDWGVAWGNICWAFKCRLIAKKQSGSIGFFSMEEIRNTNIVVKLKGGWIRPGAYVEDLPRAIAVIRRMLTHRHAHDE